VAQDQREHVPLTQRPCSFRNEVRPEEAARRGGAPGLGAAACGEPALPPVAAVFLAQRRIGDLRRELLEPAPLGCPRLRGRRAAAAGGLE
jgi:hypothetical protein